MFYLIIFYQVNKSVLNDTRTGNSTIKFCPKWLETKVVMQVGKSSKVVKMADFERKDVKSVKTMYILNHLAAKMHHCLVTMCISFGTFLKHILT